MYVNVHLDNNQGGNYMSIIVNGENNKIILEKSKEHDVIDKLFNDFDSDKYYKKHDVPEMVNWGMPQGREIF